LTAQFDRLSEIGQYGIRRQHYENFSFVAFQFQ